MSEPSSKFDTFGFDQDPFDTRIADEDIASRYKLVGREDQEHRLGEFIEDGIRSPTPMKKRLIFGEYGTGKSHHLITLRDQIASSVTVDGTEYDAIAVYIGNLGLSIKRLYEKILEEIVRFAPEMEGTVASLNDVEPESSVDEAYKFERLQDNVTDNLRRIANEAREEHGYRAIYLFIDEAEDIANEDEDIVQPFIRSFLHLVNNLNAAGVQILLGFSQGARMRITSYEEDEDTLGNALVQRFQGGEIYLGDLTTSDVKKMLIDRMDQHRMTPVGDLTPIVEETVEVVTEVTGGHPREILAVYSEALGYAQRVGNERIDGEAIVQALTGFDSFTRDEELLGAQELTNLRNAIEDAHPDALNEFNRLQGRLIGEAEAVPEDSFSEGVPGTLLDPLAVEGSDEEIRIFEQREQHGRYSYVMSETAQDFLFGSGGEGGTQIQKLDLQASSAPDKYQKKLSRGVGVALQDAGHGSMHKSPVAERIDRYEYGLYLVSIKREAGKENQTVAFGVYNGQEIPEPLVRLYVEAIDSGQAAFGVLIKENQSLSGDANRYLNEIDDLQQSYFGDRVIDLNLTTDDRDEFVYGQLLALGETDSDAGEAVNTSHFVDMLGVIPKLKDMFDESILPYPEERYRDVITHLRQGSTTSFTITQLRDELDLQDFHLNQDIMNGLRAQSLVAKDGRRWTYPELEADTPPWHELYRHLTQDGPLTMEELRDRVSREYVLDCPSGDENAMFQWYLDQLQFQDYVEATQITQDGKTVDAYQVVSVTDQFNEARQTAESRLQQSAKLLETADELGVSDYNDQQNIYDDLDVRLEGFLEIFEPDHSDLDEVKALIEDITDFEETIEETISDRKDEIRGEAKDLVNIKIGDLRDRIDDAGDEGSFAQRLTEIDGQLNQYEQELNNMIDAEEYLRLADRTSIIQNDVDKLEDEVDDILAKKGRCVDLFSEIHDTRDEVKSGHKKVSSRNPIHSTLQSSLSDLEDILDTYRGHFNRDDYDQALTTLQDEAEPLVQTLKEEAESELDKQQSYDQQIDSLEAEITSIDDPDNRDRAGEILEEARENIATGNFADPPNQLNEVRDLIEGPTREELFVQAIQDADGSVATLVENSGFDTSEAFEYLEQFYKSNEGLLNVKNVQAVIVDE